MKTREQQWSAWMSDAQAGNEAAYRSLLCDIAPPLTSFVRKRCHDASLVDDIVQEILMAIHRARHTYDTQRAFAPWMYAIARHRFIDAYRRLQRRGAREVVSQDVIELAGAAPPLEDTELSEEMQAALQSLSEKQRTVVELLKVQELSVKEIASTLEMSESAVKVTAHRAYKAMRKQLEESYGY